MYIRERKIVDSEEHGYAVILYAVILSNKCTLKNVK